MTRRQDDHLDAVDLAVLWDRLVSITDEGATTLIRTSFSTLVREGHDLSVFVFDAQARMIAQSTRCIPVFIGAASGMLQHLLRRFPPGDLAPGDVVVSNDPIHGTGHMFDIAVMCPIYRSGSLIGYAMSITHLPDIGGMGFSAAATEIYHEGLRLPAWKLFDRGRRDEDLIDLIRLNVRVADQVIGDILANVSCIEVVARSVIEFLNEYALADLGVLADGILENTRAAVSKALHGLPDGTYRSRMQVEARSETRILACRIEIRGDRMEINFDGTDGCIRGGINVPIPYTRAMAFYAVKCMTTPFIPNNDGSVAAITVSAPEGSILNAQPPSPTAGRHVIGHFVVPLVYQALADAIPERVMTGSGLTDVLTFQGRDRSGREMSTTLFASGGFGALHGLDGRPALSGSSNLGATPVEIFESLTDMTIESKALRPDSGGAGEYRGGPGQEIVLRNDTGEAVMMYSMPNRTRFPAAGLFGGESGALREHLVNGDPVDAQGGFLLRAGDRLQLRQAGGGGFGPPHRRSAERVEEDIRRGYLTPAEAVRAYGRAAPFEGDANDRTG